MVQTERDVFWYLHLTPEQAAMVPALRAALASLPPDQGLVAGLDDDVTMARFLQARDWDIRKSVKMYVGMRRLRAEHGLDSLAVPSVSSPAPHPQYQRLLDLYPHFYHKTDIWGRPVRRRTELGLPHAPARVPSPSFGRQTQQTPRPSRPKSARTSSNPALLHLKGFDSIQRRCGLFV